MFVGGICVFFDYVWNMRGNVFNLFGELILLGNVIVCICYIINMKYDVNVVKVF